MAEIKEDFLNPKSMVTPGIAVALTTSISTTLVTAFPLKFPWVALFISFIFGMLVVLPREGDVMQGKTNYVQRTIYCLLNTLIVFSMTFGSGKAIAPAPQPPAIQPELQKLLSTINISHAGEGDFNFFGIATAYAQETKQTGTSETDSKKSSGNAQKGTKEKKLTKEEQELLKNYLEQLKEYEQKKQAHDQKYAF